MRGATPRDSRKLHGPLAMRYCISAVVALAATSAVALRLPTQPTSQMSAATTRRQLVAAAAFAFAGTLNDAAFAADATDARKAVKDPEAAKAQIVAGYKALGTLLDDFDKITDAEGGDGVRRVLGTVGTTSPVYLIEPAFRLLFDKDESLPMEYIENVESLMLNLQLADGDAYSANFITFSSAKGKPEDYYKRAKGYVTTARKTWLDLMGQLKLDP